MPSNSICIYIHFSTTNTFEFSDFFAINELLKYHKTLIVATNLTEKHFPENLNSQVNFLTCHNELYDFGKFLEAYYSIKNIEEYDSLTLANDSNFYFGNLKKLFSWAQSSKATLLGLVDSYERPKFSNLVNNYHFQSHFLIFKKESFLFLKEFISNFPKTQILAEKDLKLKKQQIILNWELKMLQYFMQKNIVSESFLKVKNIGINDSLLNCYNVSLKAPQILINIGIPIIKKRYVKHFTPRFLILFFAIFKFNASFKTSFLWQKTLFIFWLKYLIVNTFYKLFIKR